VEESNDACGYWVRSEYDSESKAIMKFEGNAIARAFVHDNALDHIFDAALDSAFAVGSDLSRLHAFARDLALTHARERNLSLCSDLALVSVQSSVFDLVRDRILASNLVVARERDIARDLDGARDFVFTFNRHQVRVLAGDFARNRALALADDIALLNTHVPIHVLNSARDYKGTHLLILAATYVQLSQFIKNTDSVKVRDIYLDMYIDLIILSERIQGNLPAVESIRLVRERVTN